MLASDFANLNIWERKHLQEWIRKNPKLLGEDLQIVSMEFDRFVQCDDRLDLLALDRLGNLVVVELKRTATGGYADLQAVRYAALVSSMSFEQLVPYYSAYRRRYDGENGIDIELARAELVSFLDSAGEPELSNKPRILLCSQDFGQELTSTVLWLRGFGIDIGCIRMTPYAVGDECVVVPSRIIPLPETESYQVQIQRKEERRSDEAVAKRQSLTFPLLLEKGVLKVGDRLYLRNALKNGLLYDPADPKFHAVVTGERGSRSVKWEADNGYYSISNLTWNIFKDAHPQKANPGGVNGNWFWEMEDGRNLWDLAQEVRAPDE